MRKVLTTQSTVTCGHRLPPKTGTVQIASTAKLKVNGEPVLLRASVVGKNIPDCGIPVPPQGPQGNVICTKVLSVANAPQPKLKVNGDPVLVEPITGSTSGTVVNDPEQPSPQKKLAATANQSKLLTA
jgi:hypothetical protein